MFIRIPKLKGFSAGNAERRHCVRSGNRSLKQVDKNASNDGGERNDQEGIERSSPSTSNTSDLSRTRPRRKRRRRRRRVKKSHEEIQSPTNELKFQVKRKRGRRRRKRKRKVHAKENVMRLESSGSVSIPLQSSNGSQPSSSHSSNDSSPVSSMEYENLPYANLEVPMDLSHIHFEVKDHGVDFDLQARENHLRWLANLEKANEKDTCLEKKSQ